VKNLCVPGIILPAASPQTEHGPTSLALRRLPEVYRSAWRRRSRSL